MKIDIYAKNHTKLNVTEPKKVSVIIPNFNYSKYIIERIDSVMFQSYPIFELIVLDDCSTDNSIEVISKKIEAVKKEYPDTIVKFIPNSKNSGCVFKQWKKGFEAASGDFIWIAEADDSAESNFVEELIKPFDDEEVLLSYCESARIDGENNLIRVDSSDLYDMCRTGEWKESYVQSGDKENIEHLSVTNTILNVSSVMWRKQDYSDIFEKASEFKVAGDWFIYYNILKDGKISWNSKPLNYYRKHGSSVCTDVKAEIEFKEICRIQNEITNLYDLPREIKEKQELRRSFMYPQVKRKKIAWVIPYPGKGSGGHRTIIQNVNSLIRNGYECHIYVDLDPNLPVSEFENAARIASEKINEYYEYCPAKVFMAYKNYDTYDLVFATGWQTIDFVRQFEAEKKAYFIQDFEPWFFPMSDQYIITENSYRYGFLPVTIGRWLSYKLKNEFSANTRYFDFGADLTVYKPLEDVKKENAICFVYQPEKARRCDNVGLKALKIVNRLRPNTKIYLYGSNAQVNFDFDCENLHIISTAECNKLYNSCSVGICLSASNPSRVPFEMMAAGLPVVELYRENNLYDLPDGGILLAEPTPEGIASAIIHLIDNKSERESKSEFSKQFMKNYPLNRGFEQFIKAVEDMLGSNYENDLNVERLYKQDSFKPSEEVKDIVSREMVKAKHNPLHRESVEVKRSFLFRCVRKIYRLTFKKIPHFPLIVKGLKHLKHHGIISALKQTKRKVYRKFSLDIKFRIRCCNKYWKKRKNLYISPMAFGVSPETVANQKSFPFSNEVKFSICVYLWNPSEVFLREMIASVINQTYENFELCIFDRSDDSHGYVESFCKKIINQDSRIKYIKDSSGKMFFGNEERFSDFVTGDYISILEQHDLLHPSALFESAKAINEGNVDFIYTDEATFVNPNLLKIMETNFKPDFAPDYFHCYNYIGHFTSFKSSLLEKIDKGLFSTNNEVMYYDLFLKLIEKAERIHHIQRCLYFNRFSKKSKLCSREEIESLKNGGQKALQNHFARTDVVAEVLSTDSPNLFRVKYPIVGNPLISILIPNYEHWQTLKKCIDSIIKKSTYQNFEIIVIENNSKNKDTFDYYDSLSLNPKVKIVKWGGKFNYSAINNFGYKHATGDYILLLNNDVEVISENWLEEMLMYAQRNDVGAVGAMLYYPSNKIQHGGVVLGIKGVAGHSQKYYMRGTNGYANRLKTVQNYSCVTAACLMVSSKLYAEVDGLDEAFEVAFNDVDFCMKVRVKGYLIVWTPYAELYHYESESRGAEDTPEKLRRFEGEVDRFHRKWDNVLREGDVYYNSNLTLRHEDFEVVENAIFGIN
ncbi:glycosyltransferase [Treponema sp.]|uniref:rhamnosyltransferase WsaF family glycosyltransferase n=1 Tax=Treponema sp. TaxID=166 RepID=UPI00298E53BE|nr:glycosyltransferase [Treponema sp.]MCQ2241388.1 glycosyltransferase [Treponema sp.]